MWVLAAHGSPTPCGTADLVPHKLDLPSINLFATLTFAFAGLELAPTLGGEITDPAATLRRGVLLTGVAVVAVGVLRPPAVLGALPPQTVGITQPPPPPLAATAPR